MFIEIGEKLINLDSIDCIEPDRYDKTQSKVYLVSGKMILVDVPAKALRDRLEYAVTIFKVTKDGEKEG